MSEKAKLVKKNPVLKFVRNLFAEDIRKVKHQISEEVLLPKFQNLIYDTGRDALSMLIYGTPAAPRREGRGVASRVSYRSYYDQANGEKHEETTHVAKPNKGFDYDILFLSRGKAESVLTLLKDHIREYGSVSVNELFDFAEVENDNFATVNYGWTNLSDACIAEGRPSGYILVLPQAVILK